MDEVPGKLPKYAIVNGREATLAECVRHGFGGPAVVVYADTSGSRFYATEEEWIVGGGEFARQAAERGVVTSESSTKDKLALFKSLFKGRQDVYAHGYRSKSGGIGYAPVCKNEWKWGVCPKKKNPHARCADCPERLFAPLDDDVLLRHFKSERDDLRDVIGLYVLDKDVKTSVLVADFDKTSWQTEISAYREAAARCGIDVAVERSRSGNGGHAWIFFAEPIDAALARNLGCTLITAAMAETGSLGFQAYDRLFPAQSTVPKGGFGSLIALPFQGRVRHRGNSLFVDEDFEAYPDQWKRLSETRKVTEERARELIDQAGGQPLGQLAFAADLPVGSAADPSGAAGGSGASRSRNASSSLEAAGTSKVSGPCDASGAGNLFAGGPKDAAAPWKPRRKRQLASEDFPSVVSITKANMLFVDKEGLSLAARDRILRLAAFYNPEFRRAQMMRQSVFGKPQIIALGEETDQYLALPRGCEGELFGLLECCGAKCQVDDARQRGAPIDVEFGGTLRPRQQEAATALLRHEYGVLSAPTGFGKTVIGAYFIAQLKMRTLVIVPRTALLSQWQERLASFLVINEELPDLLTKTGRKSRKKRSLVGQIGGGKNAPGGIVDIATYQSLIEKGDVKGEWRAKDLVREYDLVLCDECQHGAAPQLEQVLRTVNARRVYGLSATPKRTDGLEEILFMHCGPIRHVVDPKEQAAQQGFSRHLKPQFTRVRLPGLEPGADFNQVLDVLCPHKARNRLIVDDAAQALARGRTPLVLTKRKEHAVVLADELRELGHEVFLLMGEGTNREKKSRLWALRDTPDDRPFAIVGTYGYLGEGFDEPRLDTLVLATPASNESVVTQCLGRLHRECEGKSEVLVYDYIDASVPMLDRMYKKRLKTYRKLGYEVLPVDVGKDSPSAGMIVGAGEYRPLFARDLEGASKSVFISSPYVSRKRLGNVKPMLEAAVQRGIGVSVVVGKPADERRLEQVEEDIAALRGIGCSASMKDGRASALVVVDERIAWYGDIPPLAFPKGDDCSLRLESCEVAFDLLRAEGAAG